MAYTPTHLEKWDAQGITAGDSHANYMGTSWRGYYCGPTTHRDADALTRSNYRVILEDLETLQAEIPEGYEDAGEWSIIEEECNHWAVGWFKRVLVHSSNEAALRRLNEWVKNLEDYPCADEEDYSREEWEECQDVWSWLSLADRIELCKAARISIFAARHESMPDDDTGYIIEHLRTP